MWLCHELCLVMQETCPYCGSTAESASLKRRDAQLPYFSVINVDPVK